ncbi:MAG: hypothetical protein NT105_16555 [Verrucomicrobia bacterium]|nr:hypothetical protein [Verrucomicrobiota bacterium]
MSLTVAKILKGVEQLNYELNTETRLVRAGQKETQETEPIMKRHEWLTSLSVVKLVQAQLNRARDPDERERLERLYFTCTGLFTYHKLARLDDQLQTSLADHKVRLDGKQVPYYNLSPRLQNEPDFNKREALGVAMDGVHRKFNPEKLALLQRDLQILRRDLGYKSYIGYCEAQKQFDYEKFIVILAESGHRTALLFRDHMARWATAKLARPFRTPEGKPALQRWHVSYLMKLGDFDARFPKKEMLPTLFGSLRRMGIDLKAKKNIKLDLEERDRKNPRACLFAAKIPQEIHLLLKPVGGLQDYETFMHEAGHALHFGFSEAKLPYEYRHMSRSNALTEIYAFLLQNITLDALWLEETLHMSRKLAERIRYYRVLCDLYMYRRYIAKLQAEFAFFCQHEDKGQASLSNGKTYAQTLTEYTGFIYQPGGYLFDMDEGFYSADYLRAWVGEAQLADYLQRNFSERWWADKRAGKFLVDLWRSASTQEAEQVLGGLGCPALDTACLERRFTELESLES